MSHAIRWTIEKITQRLALIEPLVYRRKADLPNFTYFPNPHPASPKLDEPQSDWGEVAARPEGVEVFPNTYWGGPGQEFTLRTTFQIPADWESDQPISLYLPLGEAGSFSHPEALISIDGQVYAACDRHHQEILLPSRLADGQPHELLLQGWCGSAEWNGDQVTRLIMRTCWVVQIDSPARELIVRARTALATAKILDLNDPVRVNLLTALNTAFQILDTREPFGDPFYESVSLALVSLTSAIAQSGAPLAVTMTATGHAHIDVAWLWTLDQTRKKAARTFQTVLRLMEQFPEYHFTQSQPQLYEYIRQDHPELFTAIQARIAEGRWEPIGGMWVEADCNLSGAESLARQFLLGRGCFREHFGPAVEAPVLWLPDVFGYAWALPQLIKQAGLDYFFTIKLGWNQYNRLPYDSFWWQGLDGTRVLTHFSTAPENGSAYASTYNAPATPESALGAWKSFQQKEIQKEVFMAFGYGDGGGGPTREMLENLREMEHFPGLPQARQRSAGDFFRELEATSGPSLPTWNGELYLEYHRGTYTTQARNKRANRKAEFLLHDTEFIATLASQITKYQYPHSQFTNAWQTICLNQFHDIIPGSSIGPVYEESQAQYAELTQNMTQLRDDALQTLASHLDADLLLVNPTSFTQPVLVFVPGNSLQRFTLDGQPVSTQQTDSGVWLDAGEMQPYSLMGLKTTDHRPQTEPSGLPSTVNGHILENNFLRVELNNNGDLTRIFDKTANREVLPPDGVANQFQAFEDRPKSWDAWDVDIFYDDKMWLAEPATSIRFVEYGELRQTLEIKRKIQNSEFTQQISLSHNSPRLDFDTRIHWQERHILLKVAFPVDVLAPQATYEIQWGNVTRPTHRNTSWDWARFETCAQKWVDLSEGDYGVSLLNDCKYGHDIHDNVMRITLLRSPTMPDPMADFGEHEFKYSLYPHAGAWSEATQREAYLLNDPIISYQSSVTSKQSSVTRHVSLVNCDAPNVIIETIKRAEDGDGLIVRLYESQRKRGQVRVTFRSELEAAWVTNLLEENESALSVDQASIILNLKPYQIVTLRVKLK